MKNRDEAERDPAFARAWTAHSREMPPLALDQAILAAAHRAAGAGPRATTELAAQARRPQRWWMPLAAAAAIGVVAIGVVQLTPEMQLLTPHEKLMPLPQATSPAPMAAAKPNVAKTDPAGESDTARRDAPPPRATPEASDKVAIAAPSASRAAAAASSATTTPLARGTPPGSPPEPESMAPASVGNLAAAPVPFPAAEVESKAEAAVPPLESRFATAETRADSPPAPMAAMPAAPAASPAPGGVRTPFGTNATRKERQALAPVATDPPPPTTRAPSESAGMAAPSPAPARDAVTDREGARSAPMPMLQSAPTALAQSISSDARAKARDPDAWLVRIRKLRDDGDIDGAARELREFRGVVPDAEARIPADLRAWAATVR